MAGGKKQMEDVLRWGILGTADIASTVAQAIQRCDGSTVAGVASRDRDKAQAWATRFGVPHAWGSYEELLASGEVDVVYVPLPNSLHAEWTLRALARGLPVLCEKPLATRAAEVQQIAAAATAVQLPVAEGFMYRFHPIWDEVRSLLAAGRIGPLSTLEATFTFRLDEPDSIVSSAALGGGALLDVGCYAVHAARWLAGAEPRRVSAFARFIGGVDQTMVGVLDFPNGVLARFETSIGNTERHRVALHGTHGSLVLREPWLPLTNEAAIVLRRHGAPDERIVPESCRSGPIDLYLREVAHFAAVVRGRAAPLWPLEDALGNARALDALATSAREGRVVEIA